MELIEEKREAEKKRFIADFGKVRILNGPFGPYVTDGKKNARIPKEEREGDLSQITQAQAEEWLQATGKPTRKKRGKKS